MGIRRLTSDLRLLPERGGKAGGDPGMVVTTVEERTRGFPLRPAIDGVLRRLRSAIDASILAGDRRLAGANASSTGTRYADRVNAITLGIEPGLPVEPFRAATARINEWRGRTIHAFARAETAVTECLIALAGVEDRGRRVLLPHLAGQRFEALAVAIGSGGPFEFEGRVAVPVLDEFRTHMELRNMLCHGTAQITLDLKGRWTVVLRLVTLRSKRACRELLVLTEAEAEAKRDRVSRLSQELCARLDQAKARLGQSGVS